MLTAEFRIWHKASEEKIKNLEKTELFQAFQKRPSLKYDTVERFYIECYLCEGNLMVTLTSHRFLQSNVGCTRSGFRELACQPGGRQRARTLSKLSGTTKHTYSYLASVLTDRFASVLGVGTGGWGTCQKCRKMSKF